MASTVLELNSEAAAWIIFPHWQPEVPVKQPPIPEGSLAASGWRFSATGHDRWMPFRWIFQLDPTMWSDRVMDWRLISGAAYHSGWFEWWTARDGLHCPKSARCSSVAIRLEKFSRQYSRRFARNFETYQQTSLCPDCAPCGCTSSEKLPNPALTILARFPLL